MNQFAGKTAVVTGAASGIGKALAMQCAQEGMHVVLADVEAEKLQATAAQLQATGASVLPVVTNVSQVDSVAALAARTLDTFGAVHLLFNNAGVGVVGPKVWENSVADWEWVLGVNLWGVIHGLRTFVPIMLHQKDESHIVNTASAAGLLSPPGMAAYNVSKHGVVTLSETLQHELVSEQARVRVSVFCPGVIQSDIYASARNRPDSLKNSPDKETNRQNQYADETDDMRRAVTQGMPAEDAAAIVFAALRENRFYIFSHQWVKTAVQTRLEDILHKEQPTNPAA